ncbi:MAG TPA: hypothetical protein PKA27_02245 [Fimbriimonadaceae bacterium]|nr:hypothetical protein [Fimbriimonadaceae bacterium]
MNAIIAAAILSITGTPKGPKEPVVRLKPGERLIEFKANSKRAAKRASGLSGKAYHRKRKTEKRKEQDGRS